MPHKTNAGPYRNDATQRLSLAPSMWHGIHYLLLALLALTIAITLHFCASSTMVSVTGCVFVAALASLGVRALHASASDKYEIVLKGNSVVIEAQHHRVVLPLPIFDIRDSRNSFGSMSVTVVHSQGETTIDVSRCLPFRRDEALGFLRKQQSQRPSAPSSSDRNGVDLR